MVQGPNDLIPTPPAPPNPTQNGEAVRHKRQTTPPVQPVPIEQAADTVQLSENAVQAAAYARAGGVQPPAANGQPPHPVPERAAAGPQINAVRPFTAATVAPSVAVGTAAGAPPAPGTAKVPPVQVLASASAASPDKTAFQAEPEVRPDRVREALNALASTTGNGGAVNAQVAEKLLTEF